VFGFKPTEHRVPLTGVVPDPHNAPRTVRLMSCIGPIARSVDDLSLLYSIIAGPDSQDTDVPPVPVDQDSPVEMRGLRIAVAPTFGNLPLEADIRIALETLAKQLADAGAVVDQPALPILNLSQDLARGGALVGMMLGATQPNQKQPPTLADYMTALQQRDASIAAWDRFFEQWDALLCAPAVTSAFPHCEPGTPLTVNESTVDYGPWPRTRPHSTTRAIPLSYYRLALIAQNCRLAFSSWAGAGMIHDYSRLPAPLLSSPGRFNPRRSRLGESFSQLVRPHRSALRHRPAHRR
jgi:amidase